MSKHQIFVYLLLSFIAGIASASFWKFPDIAIYCALGTAIFWIIFFAIKKQPILWIGCFILFFILGMWRFDSKFRMPEMPIGKNQEIEAEFSGVICEFPDERSDKTYLVLCGSETNSREGYIKDLRIRISVNRYPRYDYGDKILVKGEISRPQNFAGFDYENYLAKEGIYLVSYYPQIELLEKNQGNFFKEKLFALRRNFSKHIDYALKEPEASLAQGLLLGTQSKMPESVQKDFRLIGLSHIVALSGFNITIIAGFLIWIFATLTLKRNLSFWLAIAGITGFVVLTGAQASVVRAAVMGILVLVAQKSGRIYSIKTALVFAGAIMIWFNPMALRFDMGFQLSFLATLGLVYLAPRLERSAEKIPDFLKIKEFYLIPTVSAQFAVLPLILYRFENFSLIAPLANILVLPVIPLAMLLGFIAGLTHFLAPFLSGLIALPAELVLSWPIWASSYLARLSFANFQLGFGIIFAIIYGVVLWWWIRIKTD